MRLLPLPGVFQPPSDAWMLVRHLRAGRLAEGARVLDLCTGSGVLAIAAALAGGAEVTAVDISRRAVAAVKLNAWLNGVGVEARRGDLFANPPYLPGEVDELPRRGLARAWEGGRSGRAFVERIAAQAGRHLSERGTLLLVYSSVCGEEQTLGLLRAGGLAPNVVVRRRGDLGPRLRARGDWLSRRGLLLEDGREEILVVRARRARVSVAAA
jgi:release factor glutamine methyltransferase